MTFPSKACFTVDDFVVIDTETTGLDTAQHAVVAVAAAPGAGAYIGYIDPAKYDRPPVWDEQARAINGLSDTFLRAQGGSPVSVLTTLRNIIIGRTIVGHNIAFDMAMLRAAAVRCDFYWWSAVADNPIVDTRWADRLRWPDEEGNRHLAQLVDRWLGGRPDWWRPHDAASDALVTRAVWLAQLAWAAQAREWEPNGMTIGAVCRWLATGAR